MLSVLVVNNDTDAPVANELSLRQAVAQANTDAAAGISDTIDFDPSLGSSTIVLTQGQLELSGAGTGTITIDGSSPSTPITISGNSVSRVFQVDGGVQAVFQNINIEGGAAKNETGGGISNEENATLTIINSAISGNSASSGGGIENQGTLTLTGVTMSGNSALFTGGAIDNDGSLNVTECTFSDNSAAYGGAISNYALSESGQVGVATVSGTSFTGNSATFSGGAVDVGIGGQFGSGGSFTVSASTFSANSAPIGADIDEDDSASVTLEGQTWTNTATIAVSNSSSLYLDGNWTNLGSISVDATSTIGLGSTIAVDPTSAAAANYVWTNSGTITIADGATVYIGGVVTTDEYIADLQAFGINVDLSQDTVYLSGTLDNSAAENPVSAGVLALSDSTDPLYLSGGEIYKGTITTSGNDDLIAASSDSTLDGVTLDGNLDMPSSGIVTILDGLTLDGNLNVSGEDAGLLFDDSNPQALGGNGTIDLTGAYESLDNQSDQLVTFSSAITITVSGQSPYLAASITGNWLNEGIITVTSGALDLYGTWTNEGTIAVDGSSTVCLGSQIDIDPTSSAASEYVWTNTGTITIADGAAIYLGGVFTTDDFNSNLKTLGVTADLSKDTVYLSGTMDNSAADNPVSGGVLALSASTGPLSLSGGEIYQGTITTTGSDDLIATGSGGTLDGVTLDGNLDMSQSSAEVTVLDGLTLNGDVTLSGEFASLAFGGDNPQAVGGSGTIDLTGAYANLYSPSDQTLTFDSTITITVSGQVSSEAASFPGSWVNKGTIAVTSGALNLYGNWTNEGTITVDGTSTIWLGSVVAIDPTSAAATSYLWTNTGTIAIANGATVYLGGVFTTDEFDSNFGTLGVTADLSKDTVYLSGTMDNSAADNPVSGGILVLSASTGPLYLSGGEIYKGTITTAGNDDLITSTYNYAVTLDGVTLDGNLDMSQSDAMVAIVGGLTLDGDVNISRANAGLIFEGDNSQTVDGSGTIYLTGGNTSLDNQSSQTLTFARTITIAASGQDSSSAASISGNWLNEGTITVSSGALDLYSNWTNEGTITVDGASIIGLGSPIDIDPTSSAAAQYVWTNTGTITIAQGAVVYLGGVLTTDEFQQISGAATLAQTTVYLAGTLDNSAADNPVSGGVLALSTSTGPLYLSGGEIYQGTITTSGSDNLVAASYGATLDGVTLNGTLDMTGGAVAVTVIDGLTLNGTIELGGKAGSDNAADLYFGNGNDNTSQTIGGIGTIQFGQGDSLSSLENNSNDLLTIGPNITIQGGPNSSISGNGPIEFQGTIEEGISDSTLTIEVFNWTNEGTISATNGAILELYNAWTNYGTISVDGTSIVDLGVPIDIDPTTSAAAQYVWTNSGTITIGQGATVYLGGVLTTDEFEELSGVTTLAQASVYLTGTLDNSSADNPVTGGVLALSTSTGLLYLYGGEIFEGTITTSGSDDLVAASYAATLDGVTLDGVLDMTGNGVTVIVSGGLTLNSTIELGGPAGSYNSAALEFGNYGDNTPQTISGTGSIQFGLGYNPNYLENNSNDTLTIGPNITIDGGSNSELTSSYAAIDNEGTIEENTSGGTLGFGISGFINSGTVVIGSDAAINFSGGYYTQSGGTTTVDGTLTAANVSLNGGTLNGAGTIQANVTNAATVNPGDGTGTLTIDGSYTQTSDGALDVELGGVSQYSLLAVTGSATLDGALDVSTVNNFVPGATDQFVVLTFSQVSGNFAATEGLGPYANGEFLTLNFTTSNLTLAPALPDLVLQSPTAPTAATEGNSIPLSWTVADQSTTIPAAASWIDTVYLSTKSVLDGTAIPLITVAAPPQSPLEPEGSYTTKVSATVPGNLAPGSYYLLFDVDANGGQAVTDPANGFAAVPITLSAAELVVTNVAGPATAAPGQQVTVAWTLSNSGTASADGPWTEQVLLATDAAGDNQTLLEADSYAGPLPADQFVSRSATVQIPNLPPGNYWLVVSENPFGELTESSTANNTAVSSSPTNVAAGLTLVLANQSVSDGAGADATTATVTRNTSTSDPLVVTLSNSNSASVSVPQTVTIPAGKTSVTFAVGTINSGIVVGTQTVTLTASATGLVSGEGTLTVTDVNVPNLVLTLGSQSIDETAVNPATTGTITRNTSTAAPLVVSLLSNNIEKLTVPATVTIAAGQASAMFPVTVIDDDQIDGNTTATITAASTGFVTGSDSAVVIDENIPTLSLTLAQETVSEAAGPDATTGTVSIASPAGQPITIALASTDTSAATVPANVVIDAGQDSASFPIAAVNNGLDIGNQTALITANVETNAGLIVIQGSATASLLVENANGPALSVSFAVPAVDKGSTATGTVTRNTGTAGSTDSLVVDLSSSDPTKATVPASVTIPAGQTSVSFTVTTIDDHIPDGLQQVQISASATGFDTGLASLGITDVDLPDLVVSSVTAPASGYDNSPLTVSWTVTNNGQYAASGAWVDQVYLAPVGGPQSTTPAATVPFTGTVNAGQSYTQTATLSFPATVGQYIVRVVTDASQSVEELSFTNNTGTSAQPLADQASYTATVSTPVTTVSNGTPIPLSGVATLASTGAPAANVPVAVEIMVDGTTRTLTATTDSSGDYSITFQPLQNEAGEYSVAAADPGVTNPPVQAYFQIVGMTATPASANVNVVPDTPLSGQFTLTNLSDVTLTGLTATASGGPAGLSVQLTAPGQIAGDETATLGYSLDSTLAQAANGVVTIDVTTAQGAVLDILLEVTVLPLTPSLATNPGYLDSGMLVGAQTLVSFTVVNNGGAPSGDLQVSLPSTSYLSLASPATIPSLAPGASSTVTVELSPPANLPLEEYAGTIAVSNGQTGIGIPFTFTAITSAVGNLQVLVDDDLTFDEAGSPHPQGATVTLLNPYDNTDVIATGTSDATGTVNFSSIPAGTYDLQVSDTGHSTYNGTFTVVPGITNTDEVFIACQFVSYTWEVQQTTIEDTYQIQLQTEFQTDVPAPVVTITAPSTIPTLEPGQSGSFNVTITNHGLIAAQGVTLELPTDPEYIFTALTTDIGTLPAESSVVVPITVTMIAPQSLSVSDGGTTLTAQVVPSPVGSDTASTVYVDYSNTGTVAIAAPILVLTATQSNSQGAFLSLDSSLAGLAYNSDTTPAGFSQTVQFLASGATPGVIEPGESVTVPVYYAGWLASQWSTSSPVTFSLSEVDTTSVEPIDWNTVAPGMRPASVNQAAWNAITPILAANMGSTWGQYVQTLDNDAAYLNTIGEPTNDLNQLLSFEIEKANAAYTAQTLQTVTADDLPTPGMDLTFVQSFQQSISGRYTEGMLGFGWTTNWDISATTMADGDVVIEDDGASHYFSLEPNDSFAPEAGDEGTTLTASNGAYRLVWTDGTVYQFNVNGTLGYVQDTNGNTITCGYNALGQLASLTDSNGEYLDLTYNAQGNLSQLTDSNGQTETYGYDPSGQYLTSYTDIYGTTNYTYITGSSPAQNNALASIAYANGTQVYFTYDADGRLIDQHLNGDADDEAVSYLNPGGYVTTDGDGNKTTTYFDLYGATAETIDPLGNVTLYKYDSNLNLVEEVAPGGLITSYTYDANGNLVSETDPLGYPTTFTYNANNDLTSYTDANGNTTSYAYDSNQDLLSVTYANGTSQQYSYNPLGEATGFLNANGDAIAFVYNNDGLLTQETFADGTSYSYTYNAQQNMTSATDALGNVTTFVYGDAANPNLLTEVEYPDGTWLKFGYNIVGQRTQSVDQTGFTVNYTYNAVGQLSELTDGNGNLIVQYLYDNAGNLVQQNSGKGTFTVYTYDGDGEVLSITHYAPSTGSTSYVAANGAINSFDNYTYDALGNVLTDTSQDGQWVYTYDADSELTHAVFTPNSSDPDGLTAQNLEYVYDAVGNRISETVNGVVTTYVSNNVNEYTSATTSGVTTTYQYDNDGNLISQITGGSSTSYTYNELNELIGVTAPGLTASYAYDPLGNLISQTVNGATTNYQVDPNGNLVAAFSGTDVYNNSGGLIAHYTYGLGLVSQVTTTTGVGYYDFNNVGSTIGISNSSGKYVNQYTYMPFGQTSAIAAHAANPFTYVGQYGVLIDGSDLLLMGARSYAPTTGQFLSNDPIGLAGGQSNVRAYVGNDPLNEVDSSGLQEQNIGGNDSPLNTFVGQNESTMQKVEQENQVLDVLKTLSGTESNLGQTFEQGAKMLSTASSVYGGLKVINYLQQGKPLDALYEAAKTVVPLAAPELGVPFTISTTLFEHNLLPTPPPGPMYDIISGGYFYICDMNQKYSQFMAIVSFPNRFCDAPAALVELGEFDAIAGPAFTFPILPGVTGPSNCNPQLNNIGQQLSQAGKDEDPPPPAGPTQPPPPTSTSSGGGAGAAPPKTAPPVDTEPPVEGVNNIISITCGGGAFNLLAPTIAAPASANVNEDDTLAFIGAYAISVADPGGTAETPEQVTLTVSHGNLDVGTMAGVTVTGNGTGVVVLTGSLSAVNSELATLTYTRASGYNGSDTLCVSDLDLADGLNAMANVLINMSPVAFMATALGNLGLLNGQTGNDGYTAAQSAQMAPTIATFDQVESDLEGIFETASGQGASLGITGELNLLETVYGRLEAVTTAENLLFGGDPNWLDTNQVATLQQWLTAFFADVQSSSGGTISAAETTQLLATTLPNNLSVSEATEFINRWNLTVQYWGEGIFTAAQVPAGQSTDFLDLGALQTAFSAAVTAEQESQVDGYSDVGTEVQGVLTQVENDLAGQGVCATVTLQMSQTATLTRSAFSGTLSITNSEGTGAMTNVVMNITITDSQGDPANGEFYVSSPSYSGAFSVVNGVATLPDDSTGTISFTFIPDDTAAPSAPTIYDIGGTIGFTDPSGEDVSIPVFPSTITVYPQAELQVNYFLQQTVIGEDPFTPNVVIPSEPAVLGMLVTNVGAGTASNVSIATAQPTIVENAKGLLDNFQIIGTQVGTQQETPSLDVDLGNIEPGQTADADFLLTSTLEGTFTDFTASFTHSDALGGEATSLIESVQTHTLIHAGDFNFPGSTGETDYLAEDNANPQNLPDTIYFSNGTTAPVNIATDVSSSPAAAAESYTVTANVTSGWDYIQLPDPGAGYTLSQVVRSDGTAIPVSDMAWTTDRTISSTGVSTVDYELHILDYDSTGSYTVYYTPRSAVAPTVVITAPTDGSVTNNNEPTLSANVTDNSGTGLASVQFQYAIAGSPITWANAGPAQTSGPFSFTFTSPLFAGTYEAEVTATDNTGNSATSSPVTFTILATPVITPSTANLAANASSLTISGYGFDTNPANDSVTFDNGVTGIVTGATLTSLTVSVSGLSDPAGGTALDASVTVDGISSGNAVQVATVTSVEAIPSFGDLSAPTISYGTASATISGTLDSNAGGQNVPAGETVQVTLDGVTQNATLDGNDDFSATFATGTLGVAGYTISFSYAGDADFAAATGSSLLTVSAAIPSFSDLSAPSISYGTASATISGTLDANAGGQNVPAGEMVQVTLDGGTQNATLDGDDFSATFVTGTLGVAGYTISLSYGGDANFAAATPATVTFTVSALPPTAGNVSYSVQENQTLTVSAPGVLAGDTDPNGLTLTAELVSGASHGTLTLDSNGDGGFSYTPNTGFYGSDSFTYEASDSVATSTPATVTITVNLVLNQPSVTNATTTDNTQTTSGLVITPNSADTASVTNLQITNITGGTLFLNDGVTQVTNGEFITVAQGAAGLKFTPASNSLTSGSFTVQESTSATTAGLGGPTATATIAANLVLNQPSVTNATTTDNTQTTAGLVITPNAADTAFVTNFQITNITGGTLYENDGATQITNGEFITVAQGAAGLKFTPATNSLTSGSFTVQESTSAATAGLGGSTTQATIAVNLVLNQLSVTNATTTDNTQTSSGLVITPNAQDTGFVTNFQITNITGGTLYQNDGVTQITNGQFITVAQGAAGLKFTPTTNSLTSGSFTVQESTSATTAGLGGTTASATTAVNLVLHTPGVTNATTTDNTQTTSGLVITPNAADTAFVTNFQITNITGGTLYLNNGVTQVTDGEFITVAQGAADLKFTPTTNSLASGSFTVQESNSATTAGLGGPTATATIAVNLVLRQPSVTNATTTDNTQTTSGLVITSNAADTAFVTNFQITGITGGTLYQNDGVTQITNGEFITVTQGAAGLKFTPATNSLTSGSFTVQESTSGTTAGLGGSTATATIAVNLVLNQPTVTNATTTDNTQTTSGLVITPNAADTAFVSNFQITNITGGTLFLNNGTTQITNGQFITVALGAAGLKFTPTTNSLASGSFTVEESTSATTAGLGGPTATATIAVNLVLNQPSVTNATTTDNTQTTSGLVITPNSADTGFVTNFQITNITGGTLFLNDGVTQVTNGEFITVAQGAAGLKFTPASNSLTSGNFTVQESTSATTAGLGGPTATATITVNLVLHQPSVTNATTTENTQTTSGLVVTPNAADTAFVTNFQITNITGGTLHLNNGTTQVTNDEFITVAQGAAGLKFTPTANSTASGSFTVQESTTSTTAGLGGPTATATVTVNPVSQPLKVTTPPTASVNENAALVFSSANGNAITLTDAAASGTSDSVTLTVTHGTLTLGSTTGLTVSSGSNNFASMTLKGTLANLIAALNGLKFTPTTGFSGSASLVVTLKDSGDNQSASASVAISVNPTVSAPASASVNENASLTFSTANHNAITLTDGAATGSSDSLTLTVTHGTLTLGSTTGLTFSSGSNGSASMTVKGTLAHLNAALSGLKFTPTTSFSGSASLVVTVADSGDGLSGSATVAITVSVPASQPTVTVKTPVTTSVPGEPVPLVIEVSDTNAAAQAAAFTFAVSFGDGDSTSFSSKAPLVVNHVYTKTGTFTVSVTATDEYGHTSTTATVTIKVVPVAVETDPFNTSQTALFVGGTTGNDTVSFAASGKNIAVTLNGVSEGVYSTSGPLIVFGQGGKDVVHEGSGLKNSVDLLESPTADNVETDLDNEALQWAGLTAAMEILNA
jgi:RHS repeat-associated protein